MQRASFLFELATNRRLGEDIRALRIAGKGYVYYAYALCKEAGIMRKLTEGPMDAEELSSSLGIINREMLYSLLDFLVCKKVLGFKEGKYSLNGVIPQQFTQDEQGFISAKYSGAERWTLFLYGYARQALMDGARDAKTGFDDKRAAELWDSMMTGPLYSLRQFAIRGLLKHTGANERIVEYGCGSGTSVAEIAATVRAPITLCGIDNSSEMLALAEARVKALGAKNVNAEFLKKDLSMSFTFSEPFDKAFASHLMNHIPPERRERFYEQVSANLVPGGSFVLFQLANKGRFERVFSEWLLYSVPSHRGFPFLDEQVAQLGRHFSKVEVQLDGMIVTATK